MSKTENPANTEWDLESHFGYIDPYDPAIDAAINNLELTAKNFHGRYADKMKDMAHFTAADFVQAIRDYEAWGEQRDETMSYLSLKQSQDQADSELTGRVTQVWGRISQMFSEYMLFFSLTVAKMSDVDAQRMLKDPDVAAYDFWLEDTRKSLPHQLADNVEQELAVRGPWGATPLANKRFDAMMASLRFDWTDPVTGERKELGQAEFMNKLADPNDKVRQQAMKMLNDTLGEHAEEIAFIHELISSSWIINSRQRGYDGLMSPRNEADSVDDVDIEALIAAVREVAPKLVKEQMSQVAAINGFSLPADWSYRNAPPSLGKHRLYSHDEAIDIVLEGYAHLSQEMADLYRDNFVGTGRVDAFSKKGKNSGAFCSHVTKKLGIFLLENFHGRSGDIMTKAHEGGHGVHYLLAMKQTPLGRNIPLTMAETGSIMGETATFEKLCELATDPKELITLLMERNNDDLNTIVRQVQFTDWQMRIQAHVEEERSLTEEVCCKIWRDVQEDYYGPDGDVFTYEGSEYLWAYIPHFVHVPHYVRAYAFAGLQVNAVWQASKSMSKQDREDNIKALLAAGGTLHYKEALSRFFGITDGGTKAFWRRSIDSGVMARLDKTRELLKQEGYKLAA